MVDDQQRLELYLKNSERGFFVIEVCDHDVLTNVLKDIKSKKKPLLMDFATKNTDYYNTEIKNKIYDCVVFYNLEFSDNPTKIIDSFNMNRDNFVANGIMYLFLLPKYLANYLVVKTPNLHSYMTGTVDLCRVYEPPFKPLLSLDNFIIDVEQIEEEKAARRNLKLNKHAKSFKDLYDDMEYYKYHKASKADLIELINSAKGMFSAKPNNAEDRDSNATKFYQELSKIVFNQGRYELAEYICSLSLCIVMKVFDRNVADSLNYKENRKQWLSKMYTNIIIDYSNNVDTYLDALQLIEILRVLAATLFYQKEYGEAYDWFNLVNTIADYYKQQNFDMEDLLCLNFCDLALCWYKVGDDRVIDNSVLCFDKALQIREKADLDVKTLFVLDYNDLVYKIKSGKVRYEDYMISEDRAEYYRSVYSERSSIFSSYLSLVAWVRGCMDGNVKYGLELNKHALILKRAVLTEKHYSIAESHYCNGVLYFMRGEINKARVCLDKALKILHADEKRNHTLITVVNQFLKDYSDFLR